ncbi:putative bifunctional diguanylate cyclase/phosphodiesterase [Noviherbaspirillum aridicola]|uniref:Two-component system response regulator n=1 Tax=Noviherbaspirillum aridicola TaxID=2849687 RepID=A0ABQ4Q645_9BURK|nr:EAL domain-containing protein [Noviherbaspirillum aridicola]GIZ52496.1 hypothetical protein NCCP691_25100 [Noviherbaspirillum aridicola]
MTTIPLTSAPYSGALASALGLPIVQKARNGRPRIMITDDDARVASSIRALLTTFDYDVEVSNSALEAVGRLSDNSYDLMLLDLRMPGIDGHQTMDLLAHSGIEVPVIVVSGEKDIDAAVGALKRGAINYLRKPFRSEELINAVGQALQKRQLQIEQEEMRHRLECSERMYRYLVDSLPDIIYTLDPDGHFTYVNDRAQHLLGYTRDQLIGEHYSSIVHEEDLDRARYVFQERRVGDRASRNVELRMKSCNAMGEQMVFDNTLLTISFNSTALYTKAATDKEPQLFGTFGVARDITDLKRAERRILYQAYHDVLTDLPNRALFKDRLDLATIHASRNNTGIAVMFVDLDGFKLVNDTLGHHMGDQLLQQVAQRMRSNLRKGDTLARVGGDEFALLLPEVKRRDDAATIAQKFLWSLEQPFELGGQVVHLSASIGIALFPEDGTTMEDLLRHADIAMYQVKVAGKNGHQFYDAQMEAAANEKVSVVHALHRAIELNQLEVYYQPQIAVGTRRIVGAEALLRWNHPERGILAAGEFLPFVEENGLMRLMTAWLIDNVCRDLQKWNNSNHSIERISINLSPQCFDRGDIGTRIAHALRAHGIPSSQLEVEITENVFISNPQNAVMQLSALADIGVSIAVDDFGTGYSSLAYLQRFPVHTLKIDRSFVRDIVDPGGHYPMVLAVISIANAMSLKVIAEGVETTEQAAYLEAAGCSLMQGFLFAPALACDAFTASLQVDG